ncbi:radical SAM/SPASM domain-containing protein [Methylomarinum sp. Ch1-1]|uniref:Radical SAM/SPASM domain-containing protein n=1 Tax=Methylomarinum roseum TaxID=3067653 RepID=A0AAU7NUT2_9GAMM|nr:radical SAM/SPASM domain-containing protein [Methylomarinum sp. Ch1-1]MDP4519230.1 radical SAM/SPASM domain-containing protein [Methylomarinum sp. Ch1-1]
MKATVKPRINLEDRTPLQNVIPLSTPFVLFIDPVNTCNFQCTFCPTGDRELIKSTGRWQGRLDFDVYKKVIDDLGEFDNPLKVLRLYKEGEPLLHSRFADMVGYAKASGHVQYIDTTTNGYLLTPDKVGPILDAGIDRINISVDGMSDAQFWEFTQTRVDFERFVDNIRRLYERKGDCEICIKIPGDILSDDDRQQFFDTFGEIADRVFIENFAPCWPTFDVEERTGIQITEGIYGNEIGEVAVCPYIFYSMAVNTDGTVSLCFLDWARKLVVGDTRTETLKAIWNGEAMQRHRIAHLRGCRMDNSTCADCGQLSHCLPDNIDAYAASLLERIEPATADAMR